MYSLTMQLAKCTAGKCIRSHIVLRELSLAKGCVCVCVCVCVCMCVCVCVCVCVCACVCVCVMCDDN